MKVELHILQNFAPSCLNRDDTNSPKDCLFGGVRRARISSQCLKRAIRTSEEFQPVLDDIEGIRTKLLVSKLSENLVQLGAGIEEADNVSCAFVECYSGLDKDKRRTEVLLYVGTDEINRMTEELWARWDELLQAAADDAVAGNDKDDKKKKDSKLYPILKDIVKRCGSKTKALDIALFGRMVAKLPEQRVDAASQVAHAISTHRVSNELDFYTAVDDLLGSDEVGAGMMGTIEFNSACYYRYSLIDLAQLAQNLGNDLDLACDGVISFLRAAIYAVPAAKQNSMAAQNRPSFIMAVVRDSGAPQSLANAFEKPVVPAPALDKGLVEQSIERLDNYWGRLTRMYGDNGIRVAACCALNDVVLKNLESACTDNVNELLDVVRRALM